MTPFPSLFKPHSPVPSTRLLELVGHGGLLLGALPLVLVGVEQQRQLLVRALHLRRRRAPARRGEWWQSIATGSVGNCRGLGCSCAFPLPLPIPFRPADRGGRTC